MSLKGAVEALKVLRGKVADFFVIDKSLSVSGACADAKATGETLSKKVNAADIVNNLESTQAGVPLSANMGRELNANIEWVRNRMEEVEPIFGERGILELEDESALDSTKTPGTYWVDLPDEEGMLNVYFSDYNGAAVQKFISSNGSVRRRTFFDESWNEWEWENPPMEDGVEYRTTERRFGKPVYVITKVVKMPKVGTTESVAFMMNEGMLSIVDISGALNLTGEIHMYPLHNPDISFSFVNEYQEDPIELRISTTNDHYTGEVAYITVKYTK